MPYLYRPEGNRTPVNDPVLGHLSYDGVYEDPRCADDPRFIEAPAKDAKEAPAEAVQADPIVEPAESPEAPAEGEETPPKRATASKPGRS